ncbi:hypothetical protein TNCV_1924041 [Trichonephila clavipes]|nr:hypothetical protein TNCV_1924041 [Trichonephila clavipes]
MRVTSPFAVPANGVTSFALSSLFTLRLSGSEIAGLLAPGNELRRMPRGRQTEKRGAASKNNKNTWVVCLHWEMGIVWRSSAGPCVQSLGFVFLSWVLGN